LQQPGPSAFEDLALFAPSNTALQAGLAYLGLSEDTVFPNNTAPASVQAKVSLTNESCLKGMHGLFHVSYLTTRTFS
jgi:hypothetical protein